MQAIPQFLAELWKRRVVQFGAVYLAVAWVLLQVTIAISETLHLPGWVSQTALLFLGLGFFILLILAWTREPRANAQTDHAAAQPMTDTTREELSAARDNSAPPSNAPSGRKLSVCVLPFANMSGEIEQEYFSDGISEDIITDLSKVSALSVVSRNSSFVYKGKAVDLPKVARELNVSHVLEGSVRKSSGRVRITAQLIDGASNEHIWAERYDRELSDIFALQDEISEAIVKALRLKLLPMEKQAIEQRGTDNVDAYDLYLLARQHYVSGNKGDKANLEVIIRLARQATEIDPGYARAWALLGQAQSILRFYHGRQDIDFRTAIDRALALDPNVAEAHAIRADHLRDENRDDEALKEIQIALQLDPESFEVNDAAGRSYFAQGRLKDAAHHWEKAATLAESEITTSGMLITCYTGLGDMEAARRAARTAIARAEAILAQDRSNGSAMAMGAAALAVLGDTERAREWARRALLIDPDTPITRYNLACSLSSYLGDVEGALELLGPFFQKTGLSFLAHAKVDPDLEPVRGDPRFKAMIAAAEARLQKEQSQ